MTYTTREAGVEKIAELVKDIRTAMLVTLDAQGFPKGRPMGTSSAPFEGSLWFFTEQDSHKVHEIRANPRVSVIYASPSSESYLSLTGEGDVVDDRSRIAELWHPLLRAWFEGPNDPSIRLIRVDVHEAEYWDTPGGKVASLFSLVKGAITGNGENMNSDHERVRL